MRAGGVMAVPDERKMLDMTILKCHEGQLRPIALRDSFVRAPRLARST